MPADKVQEYFELFKTYYAMAPGSDEAEEMRCKMDPYYDPLSKFFVDIPRGEGEFNEAEEAEARALVTEYMEHNEQGGVALPADKVQECFELFKTYYAMDPDSEEAEYMRCKMDMYHRGPLRKENIFGDAQECEFRALCIEYMKHNEQGVACAN